MSLCEGWWIIDSVTHHSYDKTFVLKRTNFFHFVWRKNLCKYLLYPNLWWNKENFNHAALPTYVWWWIKPDVQSGKRNISATNITELETVVYLSRHEYEFPWGIEPQALGFHALTLYHGVKETLKWAASLRGLHVTHVLHTAGISNFETVMWKCVDRIRTIMILKLGKETKTDVYSSYHERGTKRCLIL